MKKNEKNNKVEINEEIIEEKIKTPRRIKKNQEIEYDETDL